MNMRVQCEGTGTVKKKELKQEPEPLFKGFIH